MNFKKKLRDFFTLTKRSKGGFTLVELIVVIAILAILAGVAIPVYSGYVKKAEKAGDEQLLAAVNKAFTAAVSAAGDDITTLAEESVKLKIDGNGKVILTSLEPEDYQEDFAMFYQGNENSAFKGYSELKYDNVLHVFKGVEGDVAGGNNKFANIFAKNEFNDEVNTIKESTFYTIGAAELMNRVHDVTGIAEELMGNTTSTAGETLRTALLGANGENMDELAKLMGLEDAAALATMFEEKSNDGDQAYIDNLLANYAVLQVADTTAGTSARDRLDELKEGMTPTEIGQLMKNAETSKEGVAKAASMYAMYTAYANQLTNETDKANAMKNLESMEAFIAAVGVETAEGTGFQLYLQGDQAVKDMEGYMASMQIIADSMNDNPEASRDLLENGFNNNDLKDALQGLIGK